MGGGGREEKGKEGGRGKGLGKGRAWGEGEGKRGAGRGMGVGDYPKVGRGAAGQLCLWFCAPHTLALPSLALGRGHSILHRSSAETRQD